MQFLKYHSFLCVFVLFPVAALAQQGEIDSLKSALHFTENGDLVEDTSSASTLNKIAHYYRYANLDSSFKYAELAFQIAEQTGYSKELFDSQYLKSWYYFNRGDYDTVLELANASLEHPDLPDYPKTQALINQLVGISYASQGDFQLGLNYFLEAFEIIKQVEEDNDDDYFRILNNIGVSYFQLEDYPRALEIFKELDSLRTLGPQTISLPVNLGFIHFELGNYEEAEAQLMRILNYEGGNFDRRALGLSTFKLGEISLTKKRFEQALNYFNQSIQIYESMENELQKVQSLDGIAKTYLQQGKIRQALGYANQALKIAEEASALPEKHIATETLYRIHQQLGDYEKAFTYLELHSAYSDSLRNEDVSREVGRLEAEYEYRERELELLQAQQQKNLENAQKVSQRNLFLLISLSLLLLAISVVFFQYRNSKLRKKANQLLQEKNVQIEQQANRLEEMNETKNHLFSIISHDLKGPLSSLYAFLTLNEMDELTEEKIKALIPELADKFKYTSNLLNNLLNWSRSQLDGYTVIKEPFDLGKLVSQNEKLSQSQAHEKNITIDNHITAPILAYGDKNMVSLVILNLFSNAVKFTPRNGTITLWAEKNEADITLAVEDTGVGISSTNLEELFSGTGFYTTKGTDNEKGTGLGLKLCKDFIERNNGTIWAESKPGQGSTFYIALPLPPEKK